MLIAISSSPTQIRPWPPELKHYSKYKIGVFWRSPWKKHSCFFLLKIAHGTGINRCSLQESAGNVTGNKRLYTHAFIINLETTCRLQFPVHQLKHAVASKTESLFNIQDRSLLAMSLEISASTLMPSSEIQKPHVDYDFQFSNSNTSWLPKLNHYSTYKIGVCWQCHWK